MGHDTVQTEDMKQQEELLQKENNRLRMESESLFSVIEFLSVQQMNTPQNKQQQKILYQLKKPVKTRNKF